MVKQRNESELHHQQVDFFSSAAVYGIPERILIP
jgi:hypothetical protein